MLNARAGKSLRRSRKSVLAQDPSLPRRIAARRPPTGIDVHRCVAARSLGRSLIDLIATLQELTALKVGFVSLSEALDLTTPSGRAFAGMLAVFAEFERDILRDRVKAGIVKPAKTAAHTADQQKSPENAGIRDLARQA